MMKKVFLNREILKLENQIGILSKSFPAGKDFCPNSGDEKMKS